MEKSMSPQALLDKVKEICGQVVADRLEPLQKRVTDYGSFVEGARSALTAKIAAPETKGLLVAGIVGALAGAKGDPERAVTMLKKNEKDNAEIIKALEASELQTGGVLINEQVSTDFIDLLTPRAVVRSFGTTVVPMDSGGMTIPKLTAAASALYIGESQDPTPSEQTFGMKKLTARKLAVLIPISNDLLRRGGPRVSTIIRNDALRSAALKEDLAFLRYTGTEYAPKGLRYQAAAANVISQTGSSSYDLDSVTADLGNLILLLENANVAFTNPGWVFAPRTAMALMTIRDANGQFAFRNEMLTGKLWGMPFRKTTQIPTNLSGSQSEVYLADFDDVIIGDTMRLEVAVSDVAAYVDADDQMRSAFTRDQTLMRILAEHDIVARYDESIAVLDSVVWTPGGGA
jgi:HK97 family phage major capsid protein